MLSSMCRASNPPARKLVRTASQPNSPVRRSVVQETLRSIPRARANFFGNRSHHTQTLLVEIDQDDL
jgi:hypothetical protein